MNAFPVKSGISDKISPRELLLRWRLNYKKHCRVEPGTYCEVHDEPTPTNTMAPRTHAAIALGPTGNLQGSVKFYCITTGRILKRRSYTPMPMPDHVIQRVNAIGTQEKQGRTFRFLNRRGEPFEWTDEVPEDDPEFQGLLEETEDTAVYPDISAELPGVLLKGQDQKMGFFSSSTTSRSGASSRKWRAAAKPPQPPPKMTTRRFLPLGISSVVGENKNG